MRPGRQTEPGRGQMLVERGAGGTALPPPAAPRPGSPPPSTGASCGRRRACPGGTRPRAPTRRLWPPNHDFGLTVGDVHGRAGPLVEVHVHAIDVGRFELETERAVGACGVRDGRLPYRLCFEEFTGTCHEIDVALQEVPASHPVTFVRYNAEVLQGVPARLTYPQRPADRHTHARSVRQGAVRRGGDREESDDVACAKTLALPAPCCCRCRARYRSCGPGIRRRTCRWRSSSGRW